MRPLARCYGHLEAPTRGDTVGALDYQLIDFDNHYYEPEDAFTRHGDEEVNRFVRWLGDGRKRRLAFGGRIATAIPNPTFNPIGKPGAYHAHLKELAASDEHRSLNVMGRFGELEPLPDSYLGREARLLVMDDQDVERAVYFPTLGVGVDGLNSDDPRMTYKLFRSFNSWVDDDWGFNWQDRIYAAPFIPMLDPGLACEELDFVLERGAKVIVMRPGPAAGGSPADPIWDPYWARINEAGIVAAYHACPAPDEYTKSFAATWQHRGKGDPAYDLNLESTIAHSRAMLDTSLALVLGNLFGRFPKVRVASVELGSAWVDYCLYLLDHGGTGFLGRHIEAFGVTVPDRPSSVFNQNIWVSPYPEDDIVGLVDRIGADRVLLGSDWPHLEGTPTPIEYMAQLDKLDAASVRRIMRDNALDLLS
jgi:predicted TIM-barrel fold metal-dependent hydrolase